MVTVRRLMTVAVLTLALLGLGLAAEAEVFYGSDAQAGFGVGEDGTATGSGSGDLADALSLFRATDEGQRIEAVLKDSDVEVFIEVYPPDQVGDGTAYGTTQIVGRGDDGEVTHIAIRIAGKDHLGFRELANTIHHEMRHAEEQMSDNERDVHRHLDADEDPLNTLFQTQADEIKATSLAADDEPQGATEVFTVTLGSSLFELTVPTEVKKGDQIPITVCSHDIASGSPSVGETGFFTIGRDPASLEADHASGVFDDLGCFFGHVEIRETPGTTNIWTSNGSEVALAGEITIDPSAWTGLDPIGDQTIGSGEIAGDAGIPATDLVALEFLPPDTWCLYTNGSLPELMGSDKYQWMQFWLEFYFSRGSLEAGLWELAANWRLFNGSDEEAFLSPALDESVPEGATLDVTWSSDTGACFRLGGIDLSLSHYAVAHTLVSPSGGGDTIGDSTEPQMSG